MEKLQRRNGNGPCFSCDGGSTGGLSNGMSYGGSWGFDGSGAYGWDYYAMRDALVDANSGKIEDFKHDLTFFNSEGIGYGDLTITDYFTNGIKDADHYIDTDYDWSYSGTFGEDQTSGGIPDITSKFYAQLARTELFFTNAREIFDNADFTVPGNQKAEKLRFFANMVKTGAPFDIKQRGKGFSAADLRSQQAIFEGRIYDFDDFGNINFGYAARVFGIPLGEAVKAAGFYQTFFQGNPDFSNWEGFFDATKDTRNIKFGYNFTPIWAR